jgi:hypothetical protein
MEIERVWWEEKECKGKEKKCLNLYFYASTSIYITDYIFFLLCVKVATVKLLKNSRERKKTLICFIFYVHGKGKQLDELSYIQNIHVGY